jgi:hypothetical protein
MFLRNRTIEREDISMLFAYFACLRGAHFLFLVFKLRKYFDTYNGISYLMNRNKMKVELAQLSIVEKGIPNHHLLLWSLSMHARTLVFYMKTKVFIYRSYNSKNIYKKLILDSIRSSSCTLLKTMNTQICMHTLLYLITSHF